MQAVTVAKMGVRGNFDNACGRAIGHRKSAYSSTSRFKNFPILALSLVHLLIPHHPFTASLLYILPFS
jgi:hypothetical protein